MSDTVEGDRRARLTAIERSDGTTFPVLILATGFQDDDGKNAGIVSILIEMGTVQTAKHLGHPRDLQSTLDRIAVELRSICTSGSLGGATFSLDHPALCDLSVRENEVLAMLMDGNRVPTIAELLHISPHTVRNHLKSMFRKLGVASQADLIRFTRSLDDSPPRG